MFHTDTITLKEAKQLGIVGADGLGFVKPQTAFKNINEKLLAEIKKGNLVWRQGWSNGVVVKGKTYGPQNYVTQRPYSGGNAFFIFLSNTLNGTDYKFFLTAKQINERGGKLKKEAKPFPVSVFIKNVVTETITVKGEKKEIDVEERGVIWYHVFPIEMVDNLKLIERKTKKEDTFNELIVTDAETIIQNMAKAPKINIGGNRAFYNPMLDYIQMPPKKAFKVQQEYYATLFHELVHSTGSKKRLDRDMSGNFGDKSYSFEELIAELGAAYLCGICEIDYYTVNNSAAYLKGWAKRLTEEINNDPNFLKRAVFKAVRATNYIIGKTLEKYGEVKGDASTKTTTKTQKQETTTSKYFYKLVSDGKDGFVFEKAENAKPIIIKGFEEYEMFITKDYKNYSLYDAQTGQGLVIYGNTKTIKSTVEDFEKRYENFVKNEKLTYKELIAKQLNKPGLSPRYQSKQDVVTTSKKIAEKVSKQKNKRETAKTINRKAITEASKDLSKLKHGNAMALTIFYNLFKDKKEGEKVELKNDFTKAILSKLPNMHIGQYDNTVDVENYHIDLVNKIEARAETLKAKNDGTDLFPELAGLKGKRDFTALINKITLLKNINEKYPRNTTYYRVNQFLDLLQNRKFDASIFDGTLKLKQALYKIGYNDSLLDFNAFSQIDTMLLEIEEKQDKSISGVATDAVLNFVNAFISTHGKTVTKEDLLYILITFQNAVNKGLIKAKHPLKEIANATQIKLVGIINNLKPKEKIKLVLTNRKEIEDKILSLQGLGFWNIIASAVVGKATELMAQKHLFKKDKEQQPVLNGIDGFVRADNRTEVKSPDTFNLPGQLGKFLQNIQPYKYSIVLTGDPHAGKTEFSMQLVNSFCSTGRTVGAFMLEQGGLESKDTKGAIDRNVSAENQKQLFVTGEAPKGINTIKECAEKFNVILIDSWQKLGIPSTKFDDLRHQFPNTIFIVIFQQNGDGGTRGGVSADYDTPVLLKVHKVDSTFTNNYVELKKNRGNNLGVKYMVKSKKTINVE